MTCGTRSIETDTNVVNLVDVVQAGYMKDLEYYEQVKVLVALYYML